MLTEPLPIATHVNRYDVRCARHPELEAALN